MSKSKKVIRNLVITCLIVLFIILSYFKLYTLQVTFSNNPTVSIVKTNEIQLIGNTYKITKDSVPYNWYDDYGFKILHTDEMGNMWQTTHSFLISAWWIILIYLSFNSIKLINRKFKTTSFTLISYFHL